MIEHETIGVPVRDGLELATDLYLPEGDGPWPVVVARTPYGKAGFGAMAQGLAAAGHAVAIQDVRGRNASPGEFYPFAREGDDGADMVEWLAAQPWCTGKVGSMGGSYVAATQCALASLAPPSLAAMVVGYGPSSFFHSSMRQNGTLELRFFIWIFGMAQSSQEAQANPGLLEELKQANARLPELLRKPYRKGSTALCQLPNYEQWLLDIQGHTTFDDYWRQRGYGPLPHLAQHADVPILWLGGWYDTYTRGTSENVCGFRQAKRSPQHLVIGPWLHCADSSAQSGKLNFGPGSTIDPIATHRRWFDRWLKGIDNGVDREAPNRLFVTGINAWRETAVWPPEAPPVTWFLGDGSCEREAPAAETKLGFRFDASDPVPTHGGQLSGGGEYLVPGAFDQNEPPVAGRTDIVRFRSAPLTEDLEMIGPLTAELWLRASQPSADVTVKVIDETPEGPAWNLTDSVRRSHDLSATEPRRVTVRLFPIGHVFKAGHRVRIDIAASNFPRFDLNPAGSCELWLHTGGRYASRLVCEPANPEDLDV